MELPAGLNGAEVELDQLIGLRHRGAKLLFNPQRAKQNLSGPSRTVIRGRGMEYAESRAYLPGDEIRNMDWRVTARTGRPHTKLYQEERERPVILLVDFSPSMFFGTRRAFKSVVAAEAAALLAWAAVTNGDRIGCVVASEDRHHELNAASGRRGVLRVLGAIAQCAALGSKPGRPGPSLLTECCRRLRQIARPGSLVFVISDHYDIDDEVRAHLANTCSHGQVTGIWIHDPLEAAPPPPGRYPVTDGQTRVLLDSGAKQVREAHLDFFAARRQAVQQLYGQNRAMVMELSTANPVEDGLRQGLGTGSAKPPAPPARTDSAGMPSHGQPH